jgi:hypothetical protein
MKKFIEALKEAGIYDHIVEKLWMSETDMVQRMQPKESQ